MTALLARQRSFTRNSGGAATVVKAWLSMERKKSPDRNAWSTAADMADAVSGYSYGTYYSYLIALKFVLRCSGVVALFIV
jgi:hypothetical protein